MDTNDKISQYQLKALEPTAAYIGTSWAVLLVGVLAYLFGLWNADGMILNEKGYYFAVLALGLYASISLQKTLRDKKEGIPTTSLYYLISWAALVISVILIIIGLFNADGLNLSEKGFYMMAFTMSLFAAVTIQKNTRDYTQIKMLGLSRGTKQITTDQTKPSSQSVFSSFRQKSNFTQDENSN